VTTPLAGLTRDELVRLLLAREAEVERLRAALGMARARNRALTRALASRGD
jgi:hypothetical protein